MIETHAPQANETYDPTELTPSPESLPNTHGPQYFTNTKAITFTAIVGDTQSTQG